MSADARTLAAWDNALAEMEQDVAWATNENTIPTEWVPPADLGPIPDQFMSRARRLLAAQIAGAEQLQQRRAVVGRQIQSTKAERAARGPGAAAYLDVSA